MQLVSATTGREHTVSGLRLEFAPPNDLLVMDNRSGIVVIPEAVSDGNVLSAKAEERLRTLGIINSLFDDPEVANPYDKQSTEVECDFLIELFGLKLNAKARILDVGCGVGRTLIPLALRGYKIDGIEISPLAVDHLQAELERLGFQSNLIIGDISRTAVTPSYDFAFAAMNTVRYTGSEPRFISHLLNMRRTVSSKGRYAFNMSFAKENIQGKISWAANGISYTWESGVENKISHQIDEIVIAKNSGGEELHREIQLQYAPPFASVQ